MNKNRKGQEEIVGFVAIVLLVAVIGVVLLGISANKKNGEITESKEISRLLDSAMEYTTDCTFNNYESNYKSARDLLKSCYSEPGKKCSDDRDACLVLNNTIKDILDNSLQVGEESQKKGYLFRAEFSINATSGGEEILALSKGNCSSGIFEEGENFFAINKGTITSTLRLCY